MLDKEKYEQVLKSLEDKLDSTSDLLSVEAYPYEEFITSNGKLDSRKKYFSIRFVMLYHNVRAERFAEVASELFFKMSEWMESYDDVYFIHNMKNTSREESSLKIIIWFNDVKSISKKLLNK